MEEQALPVRGTLPICALREDEKWDRRAKILSGCVGCVATDETKAMVEENIYKTIEFHLEGLREEDISLPEQHMESEMPTFAQNLKRIRMIGGGWG